MVACADLKPVTQKELRDLVKTTRPTNLFYSKPSHGSSRSQNRSKKQGDDASKLATLASFDEPPASALDFCRCWKRSLRTVPEKHRLATPLVCPIILKGGSINSPYMARQVSSIDRTRASQIAVLRRLGR